MAEGFYSLLHTEVVRATEVEIHLNAPPDWDTLQFPSTMTDLIINGNEAIDNDDILLQHVSLALEPHPNIKLIKFVKCEMTEFGHFLYLAQRAPSDQRLALEFIGCIIHGRAGRTLQLILERQLLRKLALASCSLENDRADEAIARGLSVNVSLEDLEMYGDDDQALPSASLMDSVLTMVRGNPKIQGLTLNATKPFMWDLFRAVGPKVKLEALGVRSSTLDVDSIGPIITMCLVKESLNELRFPFCKFDPEGLRFLLEQHSQHVCLNWLNLDGVEIEPANSPLQLNWDRLDVTCISLVGANIGKDATLRMIDDISNNPKIERLNLWGALNSDDEYQHFCEVFLQQNKGPSALNIGQAGSRIAMITESLRQNTNLVSLSVGGLDQAGLVTLAKGLEEMPGLQDLDFGSPDDDEFPAYTKDFFVALQGSLETNSTLLKLNLYGLDSSNDLAKLYLPRIHYLLAINGVRRHSLIRSDLSVGVWALVLEKPSTTADVMFFVLTNKPDLVAAPSRKRKCPSD